MDHLVSCRDIEAITDSLEKAVKKAATGDRVVLDIDQAAALVESINELWDEAAGMKAQASALESTFIHVGSPVNVYLQPRTISLIAMDKNGNVLANLIGGANLQIEAMQWQIMKKHFEASVNVVEVAATGLVKA